MSTTPIGYTKINKSGAMAVAGGAAIWGLFWIPLRYLDENGLTGLWAVAAIMAAAIIPALIATIWQREASSFLQRDCWLMAGMLGLATVLYFTAMLYSDVVRVILLFYLLPVWTTLAARIIYGEPIRGAGLIVIAAAILGVWLLLGGGTSVPIPNNIGDWCAVSAGMCWGVSLSLLRSRPQSPPFSSTAATLCVATLLSLSAAIFIQPQVFQASTPALHTKVSFGLQGIPLALIFGAFVLFPAMLGQVWGARRLPAPTAALLTMTEIVVATASAALLIGTDLSTVSLIGGSIIIIAAVVDLSATDHAN